VIFRVYGRPARPACRRVENIGNNVAQHKHRATPASRSNVACSLLSAAVGGTGRFVMIRICPTPALHRLLKTYFYVIHSFWRGPKRNGK